MVAALVPAQSEGARGTAAEVLRGSGVEAVVLSPRPSERIPANGSVEIRLLVRGLERTLSSGGIDLNVSELGGSGKVTEVALDRDNEFTYKLYDGYEEQFSAKVPASTLGEGRFRIEVRARGAGIRDEEAREFTVGVPLDLLDLVAQRFYPDSGGQVDPDSVVTFDDLHRAIAAGAGARRYVDPANGAELYPGPTGPPAVNVLPQVLGRPDWLGADAPLADRVAEARKVIRAFQWQSARPQGPEIFSSLLSRTASSTGPLTGDCNATAAAAPSLFAAAQAAPTVVSSPGGGGSGVVLSGGGDLNGNESHYVSIYRVLWDIRLPQPGAFGGPRFPLDSARLLTVSDTDQENVHNTFSPISATLTARAQTAAWTPVAEDWDWGPAGTAVGTTTPATQTPVTDTFPIPPALLAAPDSTAEKPRLADHLAVRVAGPEPPSDWPPAGSDMSNFTCRWKRLAIAEPTVLYHQAFPDPPAAPPLVAISPVSLDAGTGGLYDVGALDFANQVVGRTSEPQRATVTNNGGRPLLISKVQSTDDAFSAKSDCIGRELRTGESCGVDVTFTPARAGPMRGATIVLKDNAPGLEHRIALDGTGTRTLLPPATVAESEGVRMKLSCNKPFGWKLLPGGQPKEMAGDVLQSHVASEDFAKNHINADFNFFLYADPRYRHLLASPGNWHTADDYEKGRLEVEWERWNAGRPGLPEWAWPAQGDRAYMVGQHPFDCGHEDEGRRAEIHPPQFLVTYRNAALSRLGVRGPLAEVYGRVGAFDPRTGTAANRADVFASSFGGLAIDSEGGDDWYQPVDDLDYQFVLRAPPKPSPQAQLTYRFQRRARLHVDSRFKPLFQELPDGSSYLVTLPMRRIRGSHEKEEIAWGYRMWAGWKGDGVPAADVKRFHVTFDEMRAFETTTHRWSLYIYAADEGRGSILRGQSGPNNEVFRRVRNNERVDLRKDNEFDVELMPGQPLRVAARVSSWTHLGASNFMGTAEAIFADPASLGARIDAGPRLAIGFEDDVDKKCRKRCFRMTVLVQRR